MIARLRRLLTPVGHAINLLARTGDRGEYLDQPPFAAWCNQAGIYDRTGTNWRRIDIKDRRHGSHF